MLNFTSVNQILSKLKPSMYKLYSTISIFTSIKLISAGCMYNIKCWFSLPQQPLDNYTGLSTYPTAGTACPGQ